MTMAGPTVLEPIKGNSLTLSPGLAAVYPNRYGDFDRNAMRAISARSKYQGKTNDAGRANITGIAPSEYYLIAISRVGHGFALWNSPVSVIAGKNVLNLSPQSIPDIPEISG